MANPLAIVLHDSAAETASGVGDAIDTEAGAGRSCVQLLLELTAVVGTAPTLLVTIETSPSNTGAWRALGSFDVLSAAGTFPRKTFAQTERFVRVRWTITGTDSPSFTFALSGAAHVLYASPDDVSRLALPPKALTDIDAATQADACLAATDEADSYLAGRYTLPLVTWGSDLTMHVADLAGYQMMRRLGFQPGGSDELIVKGRDEAIAWLKGVSTNAIFPQGMVDSVPGDVGQSDAYVFDGPEQVWNDGY